MPVRTTIMAVLGADDRLRAVTCVSHDGILAGINRAPALDAQKLPQYKLQLTLTQPSRITQTREGP